MKHASLPLRYTTPDRWAETPLKNLPALLSDHAYLERKAASNALQLLNRWPEAHYPAQWTTITSTVARDEALHLHQVLQIMTKKGWKLDRLHRSDYAGELRDLVRMGLGPDEVADRLFVSALIEARSYERFEILSRVCEDAPLAKFYRALCISEMGHYKIYLKLAGEIISKASARERWDRLLHEEARIIKAQPPGPGLHSGLIL